MMNIQACLTNIYCYVIVKKNRVCCFTGHLHCNMYSLFKLENAYTHTGFFLPWKGPQWLPQSGIALEDISHCCPKPRWGHREKGDL